jgi:hypothetical protein
MTTPIDVWILWHLRPGSDPNDGMLVGVYPSRDAAVAAVDRLKDKPGFRDHPTVTRDDTAPGFFIQSYELGKDHWIEGYQHVTFTDAE